MDHNTPVYISARILTHSSAGGQQLINSGRQPSPTTRAFGDPNYKQTRPTRQASGQSNYRAITLHTSDFSRRGGSVDVVARESQPYARALSWPRPRYTASCRTEHYRGFLGIKNSEATCYCHPPSV